MIESQECLTVQYTLLLHELELPKAVVVMLQASDAVIRKRMLARG